MIWLVHFIYSAVGFALCYNYVILNYCIRFAVLPCVKLCLNSCFFLSFLLRFMLINSLYAVYVITDYTTSMNKDYDDHRLQDWEDAHFVWS